MRRTGWEFLFSGARWVVIVALSYLPPAGAAWLLWIPSGNDNAVIAEIPLADERRLGLMLLALDRLFARCIDTVKHTDVSIHRWLRSMLPHCLYRAPFELVSSAQSKKGYRAEMK